MGGDPGPVLQVKEGICAVARFFCALVDLGHGLQDGRRQLLWGHTVTVMHMCVRVLAFLGGVFLNTAGRVQMTVKGMSSTATVLEQSTMLVVNETIKQLPRRARKVTAISD